MNVLIGTLAWRNKTSSKLVCANNTGRQKQVARRPEGGLCRDDSIAASQEGVVKKEVGDSEITTLLQESPRNAAK